MVNTEFEMYACEEMGVPIRRLTDEWKTDLLLNFRIDLQPEGLPMVSDLEEGMEVLCATLSGYAMGVIHLTKFPHIEFPSGNFGMLVKPEGKQFWNCYGFANMKGLEKVNFNGTLKGWNDGKQCLGPGGSSGVHGDQDGRDPGAGGAGDSQGPATEGTAPAELPQEHS